MLMETILAIYVLGSVVTLLLALEARFNESLTLKAWEVFLFVFLWPILLIYDLVWGWWH